MSKVDYTGQTFSTRTVLYSVTNKWRWRCSACQTEGVSTIRDLKKYRCGPCRAAKNAERDATGKTYGVLHIVRKATPDEVAACRTARKTLNGFYYVKCTRCSATHVRTIHSIKISAKTTAFGCVVCTNRETYLFEGRRYTPKAFAKAHSLPHTYVTRCMEKGDTLATALKRAKQLQKQGLGTRKAHRKRKSYIGVVYGTRKIVGREDKPGDVSNRRWLYVCTVCGETGRTTLPNLQHHKCQNCAKIMVGKCYGTRVIIELVRKKLIVKTTKYKQPKYKIYWRCRCEGCGTETVTCTPMGYGRNGCRVCASKQLHEQRKKAIKKAMFVVGTVHGPFLILRAQQTSTIATCRYDVRCRRCNEEFPIQHCNLANRKEVARCARCLRCEVYTVGGQPFTPSRIVSVFKHTVKTVIKRMQHYDLTFEEALLLDTTLQTDPKASFAKVTSEKRKKT